MVLKNVSEAEYELYYWQFSDGDNFSTRLFQAISKADTSNLNKLAKGFPEEVAVYRRYANDDGYWDDVQKRIKE